MIIEDNQKVYQNFLNHTDKIADLCKPLKTYLGLDNFGYLRIYKNAKYFYATNNVEVAFEHLLHIGKSTIFFDKFLLDYPDQQYRFIAWPKEALSDSMSIYLRHGYWHGLTIANIANPEYVEIWWFATNPDNETIYSFYIKYADALLALAKNFTTQLLKFMPIEEKLLAVYKGGFDFSLPEQNNRETDAERISTMMKCLYSKGIDVNCKMGVVKLTNREIDCLACISRGKAMKEIARNLDISCRTVEKHIQSMQYKLGYHLKSDLVQLYEEQIKGLLLF